MKPICPSEAELAALHAGTLDDDLLNSLSDHLDDCAICQSRLVTMPANGSDTIAIAIRKSQGLTSAPQLPLLASALEQVAALASRPSEELLEQDSLPTNALPSETVDNDLGSIREYRLVRQIGSGGMGTVYKALHMRLDKLVALKVLPVDRNHNADAIGRFQVEMKAAGKLEHPHLVRALDAGEFDGTHYLVMEHIDGMDLGQLSRRLGPLPVADACELIRQAALGLAEASAHGLVHRDIKPSNLMLARPRRPSEPPVTKVLDLGLALIRSDLAINAEGLTNSGQIMGTIHYMAPEQCRNSHQVDIRADIYSLGATLYKLLSGNAPLEGSCGDSVLERLMALATQSPPSLKDRRHDLPDGLVMVIDQMLAKEPNARYAHPDEVAEALTPYCKSANLSALLKRAEFSTDRTENMAKSMPGNQSAHVDTKMALTSVSGRPAAAKSQVLPARSGDPLALWRWPIFWLVGSTAILVLLVMKAPSTSDTTPLNSQGQILVLPVPLDSSAAMPAPILLPEEPHLDPWLVGRELLTVAQDGSEQFKTIQAALDALQENQVVKVMDRGPYHERLVMHSIPRNSGLVSEVQTKIELPEWVEPGGHRFMNFSDFRISGFDFKSPFLPTWGALTSWEGPSGKLLIEDCRFQASPGEDSESTVVCINIDYHAEVIPGSFISIRHCAMNSGVHVIGVGDRHSLVVERNYFHHFGHVSHNSPGQKRFLLRSNVFDTSKTPVNVFGATASTEFEISNNTVMAKFPLQFEETAPRQGVTICNNILRSGVIFTLGADQFLNDAVIHWRAGYNADMLNRARAATHLPRFPSDLNEIPAFLSLVKANREYLRLRPDNAAAQGGVGGHWPTYLGALPPGPAPEAGDWFTRLRERCQDE